MSTTNSHQPDGHKLSLQGETPDDAKLSPAESPGKPARSTATILAIFALVCVGLLLLLLIGKIGIFELGT